MNYHHKKILTFTLLLISTISASEPYLEIIVPSGQTYTVSENLSGAIHKIGDGTAVFSATNNEDLQLTIIGGTVQISDASNLGTDTSDHIGLTTLAGGRLEATWSLTMPTPFGMTNDSYLKAASGVTLITAAPTTGSSSMLRVEGPGQVVLQGDNTSSPHALSIEVGGTVELGSSNNLFSENILNGGTLRATAAMFINSLSVSNSSTLQADDDVTLGSLSDSHALTIANNSGTGTVTVGDLSENSNDLTVTGILQAGETSSKLTTGHTTINDGGILKLLGTTAGAAPGITTVNSGGTLEVANTLTVPESGVDDIFTEDLIFLPGSKLKLGDGATWARAITISAPG